MVEGLAGEGTPLDTRRRTVLLVDDFPIGRKLAALKLQQAGYGVTVASSAEEGLDAAKRAPPDAIVSDIRMTGMNGFELCAAIRADPALARIPIILTSSAIEHGEAARAGSLGAVCFVRTSDLHEVLDALGKALRANNPI
jgi:CheY-like chemotaxis protein